MGVVGAAKPGEALRWLAEMVATPTDACQEWPFRNSVRDYGKVKARLATHIALEMAGRPWHPPLGNCALHSCDNPPCCNPRHLRWGTPLANTTDMVQRCRHAHGEGTAKAKLTEADVLAIRELYASGVLGRSDLAGMYGVHRSQITRIVNRKFWTHLPDIASAS